jgi:hypothetical protein|nr:hypothetical protein [Kofleriaceae bacterium]
MPRLFATWRGWVIAAVIALQVWLPLRYYLGTRDPHDERFAWRMFSPMRMARCRTTFADRGAPIALGGEFHEAWLELAQRGRFAVVEAMGAELCHRRSNAAITIAMDCTYLDQPAASFASGADGRMHASTPPADICGAD